MSILAIQTAPDDAELRLRHSAWLAQDAPHAADWQEICKTYELLGLTIPQSRDKWEDFAANRKARSMDMAAEQAPAISMTRLGLQLCPEQILPFGIVRETRRGTVDAHISR